MTTGFVKIPRWITEHPVSSEPAVAWTYIMLRLKVNWKPGHFKIGTTVQPGQMAFSYARIRERLYGEENEKAPSKNAIIRHLKKLEACGLITLDSKPNQFTMLTIVDWESDESEAESSVPKTGTPDSKVVPKTGTRAGTPTGTPTGTDRRRVKKGKKVLGKAPHTTFVPPTTEQVAEYCMAKGFTLDPAAFIDHHTARDWTLSRGLKMKDWKAAVRTWQRNEGRFGRDEKDAPSPKVDRSSEIAKRRAELEARKARRAAS